jgi:quercetin dioxygenase-like cupin family protein
MTIELESRIRVDSLIVERQRRLRRFGIYRATGHLDGQGDAMGIVITNGRTSTITPGTRPTMVGRPLAAPVLVHDLREEASALRTQPVWRVRGHNAITLVKHSDLRLVLLVIARGARIQEHAVADRSTVYVIHGAARLHLPAHTIDLGAAQMATFDKEILHDIEALEDSEVLLTVAWPE